MTQVCKCELDGFQGAIFRGDCPLHKDDNKFKPMTNNSLQDQLMEFWDTYKDKVGLGEFSDELTRFVQNLLTKKDQEHKAELEMIKGEIDKVFPINTESNMVEVDMYSYDLAKKDAISILDSHINKIST